MGAICFLAGLLLCAVALWVARRLLRRTPSEPETRHDPLFGELRWSSAGKFAADLHPVQRWVFAESWSGWWHGEFRTTEGQSASLSVSSEALDRSDVRRLFSRVTADLEAVHQRLADEHLPDLNTSCWADSPLTRDAFLSRFQLCAINIWAAGANGPNGCVYVEFDDPAEEGLLTGYTIGFFFHLDGTVEGAVEGRGEGTGSG